MIVACGFDHAGFPLRERLLPLIEAQGHEVLDVGTDSPKSCDYPDSAFTAAEKVVRGEADLGILLCGSGIGMCIAANKVPGIRAALCHDELTTEMSRRHNNANILCLPADLVGEALMRRIIEVWLKAPYEAGRHENRIKKIREIEQRVCGGS